MKAYRRAGGWLAAWILVAMPSWADEPRIGVKDIGAGEDTSIVVKKGANALDPDYQIVTGTDEISGDPVAGTKESYASWKTACADWKKEMREDNAGQVLALSCGAPSAGKDASQLVTQRSTATYRLRVRIRDSAHGGKGK